VTVCPLEAVMVRPTSSNVVAFPTEDVPASGSGQDTPARSVAQLRSAFVAAVAAKTDENAEAAEAERYYHCVQWDKTDLQVLSARNQAPVTFNRFARKVNTILGVIEKVRQDPKAYPRTPSRAAEDGAELATNVLMYALGWQWNDQQIEIGRRTAIRGISGVECCLVQGDQGDPDIEWDVVDQRDFFYDPKSSKHDFSDCLYLGTTKWWDVEEAVETWPDAEDDLRAYIENGPVTDFERGDERNRMTWINRGATSIRIVDQWYKKGKTWHYCIYSGSTVLEHGESPYNDEKGRSTHKFEMLSYEIDSDNDRYAPFRNLKSAQDEVNQRRSKALHALNSRRVIADDGAVDDVDVARRELARNDGWLVKNPGKELITEDQVKEQTMRGHMEFLQEAKNEIDSFGPNPGLVGTDIDPSSGRAIALLQAAGIAEMGPFMSVYRHWKLRVYRKTWCAVQKFWQAPRWIRVTDDENLAQFVQVNGWDKDPTTGFPTAINQLAALDVDIIVDEGSSSITTMQDTFDALAVLAKGGVAVPPEIIVEMSNLPSSTKQKLLAKFEEQEQGNPMQAQAIQLKLEQVQATIEKLRSEAQLNMSKASQPPSGPQQQIDTPADTAKAGLDQAKAAEIYHKIDIGAHLPPMPPDPDPPQPGLFEVNLAKARQAHAAADASQAQTVKTLHEAQTIAEAPPGMLQQPPPVAPGGGGA
jgi:hypothetical protein